jgi:glutaconate CoA-transferase subunit B
MIDVMGTYLEGGRVDVGFLSGAQVDRYGNINTTCIGDYHHPEVRLVGSGGANPIASLVKRVVIILPHEKRRLVQKVDYLTTPGYISGEGGRENVGLPLRSGPVAIITSMGVLRFDDSKEAYLDTIHPQVDVEQVRKETGWELKIASNLRQTEPPTKGEVRLLREVIDPEGLIKRYL